MAPKEAVAEALDDLPEVWVGLGASAGGLEALRGFVRNLPSDLPATYIVAQHMAPHHRSMLSEIIGRETSMPVLEVANGLVPQKNTVYITPPNSNIVIEDNKLVLIEPSKELAAPKPSVDLFFGSLAKAKGRNAIAIILSGTGSDGSVGIRQIRAKGGVTITQDEMTAKYTSMPAGAVETGCVDLVMSPEEIGAQFAKIIKSPRNLEVLKASPLSMDSVSELMQLLLDYTKVNFRHYKTATFQRRVERRMAAQNVSSLEQYVEIAKNSSREIEALFRDLLITVTSFFRDPDEFQALRRYVRQIVSEKGKDPIRVWVAGTATGEEAYTIAILFAEEMGGAKAFANAKIQIFATDVDTQAIEVARRGYYSETTLAEVPEKLVRDYFESAPVGYTVKKTIRDKIVFSVHNIAQDPPFLNLDMISCRNLLIYFQSQLQAQVFSRFHYALVPRGVLFLGKSESVTSSESLFRAADPDRHIFYQRPSQDRKAVRSVNYQMPTGFDRQVPQYPPPEARELAVTKAQLDSVIAAIGPNGLIINSELQIIRAFGNVERFVGIAAGNVDTSASSLLREPYRQDIRANVPSVIRRKQKTHGIVRSLPDKANHKVRLSIYPIENGPNDETTALVVFDEWVEEAIAVLPDSEEPNAYKDQIETLSKELGIARENLRQMVDELETNNEELQALNEELQSSNEELQSTNEEMETSNEELQSTNEELSTVNEELQVNSQQLNAVNQSLRNILENVAIPMLVVDRDLNITNASRASEKVFGVSPDLALPHISRCRLPEGFPNLVEALDDAMGSARRVDHLIDLHDQNATLTVVPHFSSNDELVGGIVLLADNTDELRATRNELQLIFDNLPASILVRNRDGEILKANKVAGTVFGMSVAEVEGRKMADLCDPKSLKEIEQLDKEAFQRGRPIMQRDIRHRALDGRERILSTSRIPFRNIKTGEKTIYELAIDISEQYDARAALEKSEERLEHAVRVSGIGHWEWDIKTGKMFWSETFKQMLGLSGAQFKGRFQDFAERIHPDDKDGVLSAIETHHESIDPFDFEYRLRHVDGTYRWVHAFGQAQRDDQGDVVQMSGTVQNVTEQKDSSIQMRERNEKLVLASKLASVGHWKIDLTNNGLFWSDEVFSIHGVTPENYKPELVSATAFYHEEDVGRVQKKIAAAVEDANPFEFEARIVRPDGELRSVSCICSVEVDKRGKAIAIFGVFRDVTEDRKREESLKTVLAELSRSNEELNRFSYVCSHDMKEPVRMIEAMITMLLEPEVFNSEEERTELLDRIRNNMARLRSIIESLLGYSRVAAKVEITNVDLNAVMKDVTETLSFSIAEKKAKLVVGKMPVVTGARVHFIQLFQNLIGNSLKYCEDETAVIKVSSRSLKTRQILTVEDNGPGVPEDGREKIFELFGRLQLRDDVNGTGLGLSICKRIAQQYGGDIVCLDSKLGGARFDITIPLRTS